MAKEEKNTKKTSDKKSEKRQDKSNKKTTDSEAKEMSFWEHLEELRWCIIKSVVSVFLFTVISFPFSNFMLDFLTLPNDHLEEPAKLIFLKPTGMLVVRMEIALAIGIIASLPVILYQLWKFISPGLLASERKYVFPSIFITTACFLLGSVFAYIILIPTVLPFLFSMGTDSIAATININDYMSFVLRLILIAGLIFELPVLTFLLSRVGIVTPAFMRKYRRYGIVSFFIFSAVVTPPDPMSQSLMALPLIGLYEISIWVSAVGQKKRQQAEQAWEDDFSNDEEIEDK